MILILLCNIMMEASKILYVLSKFFCERIKFINMLLIASSKSVWDYDLE